MGSEKTVWWMVIFGIVRHLLSIVGAKLEGGGFIDPETHQRLLSEGTAQIVGWVLMLLPILWSIAQKLQVWEWVKKAFHLPAATDPNTIPVTAPGPNVPI